MGKIKFTAFVAEVRNKVSGSVFSKNRYGNYVRTKVTPVNPQTTYQQNVRQGLANISASWRALTQAQRDQWIAAAPSFPRTDIFGDSKILSGQALFVGLNQNLEQAGAARIDIPALPVEMPQFTIDTLAVVYDISDDDTTITFDIDPATVPAGFSAVVYATPGIDPGINFVKNRFRYLGVFTPNAGTFDISAAWVSRFGNVVAGQKVFVRVALVSTTSGQLGVPQELVAIATSQA